MATTDFYLKIDGIDGESQDDNHTGEIDLESWSWGCTQSGASASGGGGGKGKVSMQDFKFVMKVNKATPKLIEACASGKVFGSAILTCRKAGGEQEGYLSYKFTDVLISSYQTGGSGANIIPTEQISFNYAKMEVEYKEQKSSGSMGGAIKGGWDLKKNKTV
ncbi:MAG: type VI secretion system tube protein Hcp [Nitrosomonas sp.]|nr:type VI secretion system tube protein Hcp [Nitrosomonas sp.]